MSYTLLNHVRNLYEDNIHEFNSFLEDLHDRAEEGDDDAKKLVEKYGIIEDPTIPEWLSEIILYGFIYELDYVFAPNAPPRVVEEENKRLLVNYDRLTTYIIKRFCVVSFKKTLYIYDGKKFCEDEGEIGREIESILVSQGIADKKKIRDTINEVLTRITLRTFFRENPFNSFGSEFIPLRNGVLWRGQEYRLLPYSPAFGYTYSLPVSYDGNAECPKIDQFISQIVAEENRKILYEIPALALLQNPRYNTAYMLVGSGSNGKSTYLQVLEAFLGRENVSNVSLQELCEDRFKAAELFGKLANIYADLPKNPIRYAGKFKILTGGDSVTAERKYRDPFSFVNKAVLIFSANELPEVTDQTYAFWRRWTIVEFPNTFPVNSGFVEELTDEKELSGFLNRVLEAMTRVEIKGLTKTKAVEELKEAWMKRANSVYAFVRDRVEQNPVAWIPKEDLYNAYVEYCDENDLPALANNKFAQELKKFVRVKATKRKVGGARVHVWEGIQLKFSEEEVEEGATLERFADWSLDEVLNQ